MGACTGTGKDGPDGPDGPDGALQKRSYPPHSPTPHAPMRRQWVSSPRFPVKQKPDPAEPTQNPGSSGMRPEQALEAIIQYPRAPREIPSSPEPPCARRIHPAAHHPATRPPASARHPTIPRAAAGSGRSEPWRRSPNTLAHSAKDHPSQSLLSDRRSDPAEPTQNPGSSGMRPEQALEAIIQYPRAPREISSSPEPPCARRTHPAEPTKNPSGAGSGRSEPWR